LLIGGVKDSLGHAKKLAELLNKYLARPFMVNLIPYNYSKIEFNDLLREEKFNETKILKPILRLPATEGRQVQDDRKIEFRAPNSGDVNDFRDYLVEHGVDAVIRHRFGADIAGACGQLALKTACN